MQLVAVSWLAWELTKSTNWLAIVALLDIIPNVVLMPFAGAFADRHDRHRIMVWTSTLLLIQSSALAAVAWFGILNIWLLSALVLIHGVLISFMVPAMFGILPRFVGKAALPSAIAVSSSYSQLAIFAGPALGGWIIAKHGIPLAFLVNALGYAALLLSIAFLKTPADFKPPKPSEHSLWADMKDGLAYILRDKNFLYLLAFAQTANFMVLSFFNMVPAYSEQILGLGVEGVSTILAASGLGAVVAALWLAHAGGKGTGLSRIIWSSLISLIALAALVLISNLYLAAIVACLVGFFGEIRKTVSLTFIQLNVEEAQRGRLIGTMFMLRQLSIGAGTFLLGALAAPFGLQAVTVLGATLACGIWLWLFLQYRRATPAE